jgi:ppGpp synthetase/RelA/SpoT-type nucleotidyltranferase
MTEDKIINQLQQVLADKELKKANYQAWKNRIKELRNLLAKIKRRPKEDENESI